MARYRITLLDRFLACWDDTVFQFAGQRFRECAEDRATMRFLEQIEVLRPRMTGLRADFRRLIADQPLCGLIRCLSHGTPEMRRLAIWLLGRCGNSQAIPAIKIYATHGKVEVRRLVVHALCRLRARAELLEMSQRDSDPWIRQYAAAATERTFKSHLKRFIEEDARRLTLGEHQTPRRMPLVWNVSGGAGRQPKSADFIRAILERIRHLLRGNGAGSKI